MKKRQKGFTLFEILVVLALTAMLVVGLVRAIVQTSDITLDTTTQITALEDIKEVATQIRQDIRMAATSNLEDGGPVVDSLTLTWTTWYDETGEYNPVPHSISYSSPSGGELQRNYDDGDLTTVGRYISNIGFSQEGTMITVSITSSPTGDAETAEQMTYEFYLQQKGDLSQ